MKIAAILVAMAGLSGVMLAHAGDEDAASKRPAAAAPADRETMPGAPVYHVVCAQCHDKAVYKAPSRSFLNMMAPDTIYAALSKGGLMSQQAARLTDEQRRQVADYVGDASLATALRASQPPMCSRAQRDPDLASPPRLFGWGADYDNSHSIPASIAGLPAERIPNLKLRWAFAYPVAQRARSQPTVAMGSVFVGSQDGTVYALEAKTGCVRWRFKATSEVRTTIVLSHADSPALRGRAPLAFFGDLTGRVYALDARTGKLRWKATVEEHPSTTMTGSPVYFQGRLYVAVSSLEEAAAVPGYECCSFRGSLVALEALTGRPVWKRYMIDNPPAQTGTTAGGTRVLGPSGAAVWNTPTLDLKRRALYVGTGDNYSDRADDRSDAVIAVNMDTGAIRWSHQVVEGDVWNVGCVIGSDACPAHPGPDFDIGAGTTLVHLADGRDFVVAGLKSGHAVAIDVDHPQKPAWSHRLGRGGIEGGIQFALAHDETNLYVPISDMQVHDKTTPTEPQHPGLYALDPATGALRWSAETLNDHCEGRKDCDAGILSAVTVIPGAVFAGHMDGRIRAYDAASGKVLWEYDSTGEVKTTSGAMARGGSVGGGGPMVVDGSVYINSGYGVYWHMPGNLLLAFSVDGR
ncbi:MAG: PQQ-binding-like beta-propeller repeat protein [Steroidobacteraceae bacterium]